MRLAALALGSLLLSGCFTILGPADRDSNVKDVVAARARWNTIGVTDYDVVMRSICFCMHDGDRYRYSVRGNVVTSVVKVSTGEAQPQMLLGSTTAPIEAVFDLLEHAIQRDAELLEVDFDDIWGFPRRLKVDLRSQVADDEFQYYIENFQPLSR